jgi:S1-C subfamily serine protease
VKSFSLALVGFVSCFLVYALLDLEKEHMYRRIWRNTVSITNMSKNSGGTGSILSSSSSESTVLTNKHVCEIAKSGGLLVNTSSNESFMVVSYIEYPLHDLCLITVAADLHGRTVVSNRPLEMLEPVLVSGHPLLLPTIQSGGHYAGDLIITVMTGLRACTEEDMKDPGTALGCVFSGGFTPAVSRFQSIVISSLIQPGSSGSAIYNNNGEIVGVIFAGRGDLGYGMGVPLAYVRNFLAMAKDLPVTVIDNNITNRAPASGE